MTTERCAGCNLLDTKPVTLSDGRIVCSSCPEWREECAARHREALAVLAIPTTAGRREYIDTVEHSRGKLAGYRLRTDVLEEWDRRHPKE
jgi:hypothetical protein